MKYALSLILLFLTTLAWAEEPPAAPPSGLTEGLINPGYEEKPDWFKESFLDIREDIKEATAANKRVILYFYQDGCPYCAKLLKENFGKQEITDKTRKHFDVVSINMWGDRSVADFDGKDTTEKAFAADLKVQYTPTMLFLDESGKVVLRVNGYYAPDKFELALDYSAGKHDKQGSFKDYYAKLKTEGKVTSSDKTYALPGSLPAPLRLQDARKDSKRPLMVVFAQQDCDTCAELFDDIFKRKELAYTLSNLDVAQANPDDEATIQTPDGKEMKLSDWAKSLDIKYSPSLVFFDNDGKEAFRTEAYFKAFHTHGAMDYVVSGAYQWMPEFQRYLQHRREVLAEHGFPADLME
ncbi:MAG: thioredoxin fold domain-containing protein [Gammaproteobacteria bacterium]|nr:thioredoxin fold domain-containing protein [Gammaproteobacteria bacterium]MBU1723761.1 thioredoxin fold domain-containing protein [Gammaproteobacteria bacterium]MBU2004831.1 thioredoxin fold domain-containing protein [Gammaproteobacteria bacterium]